MTLDSKGDIRVLFAVSSLSPGGAERVISELANSFVSRFAAIGVLTLSSDVKDHYSLDPHVERIALDVLWNSRTPWVSLTGNLRRSSLIREAVKSFRPDIIISFIEQTNVRVLAAVLGLGVPVIVSERIDPRRYHVGRAWNVARRLLYPFASGIVVQSEPVASWARAFLKADRVHVVPNFVRSLPMPSGSRSKNSVLAVGRLDRQKGFDILLRAFHAAGLAERGASLTILGDGPERATLDSLARELRIEHAVALPGVVSDPERWMAQATVFVLSSRFEGFPNVLLEAMAMGCPVIASDCDSGPRDIVRDDVDGVLVPPEDVNRLSAALARLMKDAAAREAIAEAGLAVRERFSKEAIVSQWDRLTRTVLAG